MLFRSADMEEAAREILWYGADVIVNEPQELKTKVIAALDEVIKAHG